MFQHEVEAARQQEEDGWNFSADLLEALGMIPCGYLNYYYHHDKILAKQLRAERSRGEEVKEIERQLMELYQDPDLKEKPKLLEKRGGAYYSKAAVSLISALANDKQEIHIVNTRNQGAIPDLPDEVVVEVAARVGASGAQPIAVEPMPAEIRGLVQAVKAYEELAAIAGAEGDHRKAFLALAAHPLTPSIDAALLEAHQEYLPQFSPGGKR
jgi:6-phospho-beta-glucosidase